MTKAKKQPRKSEKKEKVLSLRNPFLLNSPLLPKTIANKLKSLERIIPNNLEEVVS
jgi:hypothetical protein